MKSNSLYEHVYAARVMLEHDEGFRQMPYKCPAGYLTIGVGRNLEAKGITKNTAYQMLDEDIDEARDGAIEIFGAIFFNKIEPVRQLAIINLIFNLGKEGFKKFDRTIELIKKENWLEASENLLKTKYATQVKSRANRVALMLRTGEFPYKW